jgi:hypothetical protein
MVLMILVYILSNIRLLKISFEYDNEILTKFDENIVTNIVDSKK